MLKSTFLLSFLFISIFICHLNATTYYVANNGGNDSNSGTSSTAPWKSISKVNSIAFSSGDIISFKCGDRFSDATLIPPTNFLTFNSYGTGAKPVIDGQSSRICVDMLRYTRNNITFTGLKFVNGFHNDIVMWNCNNITFESCNIDSSRGGTITYSNVYAGQGNNLIVRNSTISYGAQSTSFDGNLGIYLDGTDNCLMEYDTLIGSFSNIRVAFGTSDLGMANGLVVRYCVVKNGRYDNVDDDGSAGAQFYYNVFDATNINIYLFTDGSGSYDAYATRNSSYYNNTFFTHGSEASIHLNSQTGVNNGMAFKNNIFYSDNSSGYYFYEEVSGQMGTWAFTNNLYYMTSSNSHGWVRHGVTYSSLSQWQSLGYDANSIYADPLFTNYSTKDYSLQTGSKAINSGVNVGLTTDITGTQVPSNYPDLGAYQHIPQLPSTYYVANNGNDGNSGKSASSPWKTISKVNSITFIPGDIILFNRGDIWYEMMTPLGNGNASNPIIFDAYGTGCNPIIDGGSIRSNCISVNAMNYLTIRNFKVQYSAVNTNGNIHIQNTDNIRIENCDIFITSHGGVFLESSKNAYVGNCTMSSPVSNNNNQADGIYSQKNNNSLYENNSIIISDMGTGHNDGIQSYLDTNMTFKNNYIFQNNSLLQSEGIDVTDGAGIFYVYNNVIKCPNSNGNIIGFNNDVSGSGALRCYQNTVLGNVYCLRILKCPDIIIKNNIFYSNSSTSIIDIGTTLNPGSAIDYNLYNRSGSGSMVNYEPQGYKTFAQWQNMGFETHGLNANPVVNDTLYPDISSPAINVGTTLGGIFSYDKEGTQRPVNGVDLGAYEVKSTPVPVELISFTGNYINKSVQLNWNTATEINNQGFEIERNTNSTWEKIGYVEGKGNSSIVNEYSFEDKYPIGNLSQYRLKQVDNNGNFKYSDAITLTITPQSFTIGNYPNPFNPSTKIRYSIPNESMIKIIIYNIIGEQIEDLKNEIQQPGNYEINWSGSNHPSGIYLLAIVESPVNGSAKCSKTIKMDLIK